VLRHVHTREQIYKQKEVQMNWFGLFTMAMIVVLIVWGFAYEFGYEKAEKDWTMSDEWIARQEMEMRNWSKYNHPTNKDWN
jgi:hypothetical protein